MSLNMEIFMKSGWKFKVGILVVAMFGLTACPKKKGSSVAATPGTVAGLCTVNTAGQCVGGTAFMGSGSFRGTLNVTNPALYNQFLIEAGICVNGPYYGNSCQSLMQWLGLSVNLNNTFGSLRLTPYNNFTGHWSRSLRRQTQAYMQGSGLGFQLVTQIYPQYQTQIYPPQPIVAGGNLQILATFTTAMPAGYAGLQIAQTTVLYRGTIIAQGTLTGNIQPASPYGYNQPYANPQQAPAVLPRPGY